MTETTYTYTEFIPQYMTRFVFFGLNQILFRLHEKLRIDANKCLINSLSFDRILFSIDFVNYSAHTCTQFNLDSGFMQSM